MAISVAVTVGNSTADALREKLLKRIAKLRILPGTDDASGMGPLVTQQHLDRVRGYLNAGVQEGSELVVYSRTTTPPQGGPRRARASSWVRACSTMSSRT